MSAGPQPIILITALALVMMGAFLSEWWRGWIRSPVRVRTRRRRRILALAQLG